MADLAQVEELESRLHWALSPDELRVAQSAISDLSEDARMYGSSSWTNLNYTPQGVRVMVLRAATRYMKNLDAYQQSRAGDESVTWFEATGAAEFSQQEKAQLQALASHASSNSMVIANTYAYDTKISPATDIYVPVNYGGARFPFLTQWDMR